MGAGTGIGPTAVPVPIQSGLTQAMILGSPAAAAVATGASPVGRAGAKTRFGCLVLEYTFEEENVSVRAGGRYRWSRRGPVPSDAQGPKPVLDVW